MMSFCFPTSLGTVREGFDLVHLFSDTLCDEYIYRATCAKCILQNSYMLTLKGSTLCCCTVCNRLLHHKPLTTPRGHQLIEWLCQGSPIVFGAGAAVVPNVPVSVAPVPYTIEIDLQDVARRVGCILFPFF